jgi:hypothetical protein
MPLENLLVRALDGVLELGQERVLLVEVELDHRRPPPLSVGAFYHCRQTDGGR